MIRVAVDTGGTFTDVLLERGDGARFSYKCPSTPEDPSRAIVDGLAGVLSRAGLEGAAVAQLIHGTTVGTNALLERRGARVVLVTNEGFEDVLWLGRQARRSLYALAPEPTQALVAEGDAVGVAGRLGPGGEALEGQGPEAIEALLSRLEARGVGGEDTAVAICLLHAYANDEHERAVAAAIERRWPGLHVSRSSSVLPEFREYERASTTAADAFIGPVLRRYLGRLEGRLSCERLSIMQSNGGVMRAREAGARPVSLALSGPAGGALGGLRAAQREGIEDVITFDMGGTSTDVALCVGGALTLTTRGAVGGLPIRVPMVDIHTVGAGGGSIARVDAGGALKVGPESSGARPGPACYGEGDAATVTDANAALGRLGVDGLLGGAMTIDVGRARDAIERAVARPLGVGVEEAAAGVIEVALAAMARAVKVISLERGHDPRGLVLVAFGGAGGMHACGLAEQLGVERVLVPASAGLLSAAGMLEAGATRHLSRTLLERLPESAGPARAQLASRVSKVLEGLEEEASLFLSEEGVAAAKRVFEVVFDLRYRGQSFEVGVPVSAWREGEGALKEALEGFAEAHRRRYGYALEGREVELVHVRLAGVGEVSGAPQRVAAGEGGAAAEVSAPCYFEGRWWEAPRVTRRSLEVGVRRGGPMIVSEYSSTTVVAPGWTLEVLGGGALLLTRRAPG